MMRDRALGKRMGITAILVGVPVLAAVLRAEEAHTFSPHLPEGPVRVLRFSPDQYMGSLYLTLESEAMWAPKYVRLSGDENYLGRAQGDVTVPADQAILLNVALRLDSREAARLRAQEPDTYERMVTNRGPVDPGDLSGLSALDPNDLYMLNVHHFRDWPTPDEHLLEPVAHLTGLRVLRLQHTGVTDKGLEPVRALRHLQAVEFTGEQYVKNQGLAVLKDLPDLQYLDLDTGATDAGLKHVAQMPNLRWLKIQMGRIWGPGLAELASAPRLERLCLVGEVRLTNRQITYLEGFTQLKSLTLWGVADNLTDASLASIAKLENLEELYFVRTSPRFTPTGLAHLQGLKKLRKVDFGMTWSRSAFTYQGDEVARQLAAMPQLESIEGVSFLSAEGVKTLATVRNLECLHIALKDRWQDYDGPTGLSHLAGLDALEELWIETGDVLSEDDLAGLEHLKNLKHLTLISGGVTDEGLALIGRVKQLEHLELAPVKRSGLNHLNGLANLKSLYVNFARRDTSEPTAFDEGTLDLSGLRNLEHLGLSYLELHEDDLAFVEHLTGLEKLAIGPRSPLPATSLRRFAKLPQLTRLTVYGLSHCTGEDLAPLGGLRNLEHLYLSGQISDTALASLDNLSHLSALYLYTSAPIQPQTVADLRQHLQGIEYFEFHDSIPGQQRTTRPPQRQVRPSTKANRTNRPTKSNRRGRRR